MQSVIHPETGQKGIALQDTAELFTVCNVLGHADRELQQEVQGALDEAIESGENFEAVQLFGDDAHMTVSALRALARAHISHREAKRDTARLYWRDAARQMISELQDPAHRQATIEMSEARNLQLAEEGQLPYHERLIGWRAAQLVADHPGQSYTRTFERLADLELQGTTGGIEDTRYVPEEAVGRSAGHSDRVRVLVK